MILVADQKRSMAEMFARRLRWEGFSTEVASDATDALKKIAELPIDLALLDPAISGSGIQVLHRVRANPATAHLPIVFFGTSDLPADLQAAQQAGASAYLVKGRITPNELLQEIRRLMLTAQASASTALSFPAKVGRFSHAGNAEYLLAINPEAGDARKFAAELGRSPTLECEKCGSSMMLRLGVGARKGPWTFGGLRCPKCASQSVVAPFGKLQAVSEVHL